MLKHAAIKKLFVEESYTQEEKHDTFLEVALYLICKSVVTWVTMYRARCNALLEP